MIKTGERNHKVHLFAYYAHKLVRVILKHRFKGLPSC